MNNIISKVYLQCLTVTLIMVSWKQNASVAHTW